MYFNNLSAPLLWVLSLIAALLLAGCGGDTSTQRVPSFTKPPIITLNSNPNAPLAAIIEFETDQLVSASYVISDGKRSWPAGADTVKRSGNNLNKFSKSHKDVLLRFKSGKEHFVRVRIENAFGVGTEYDTLLTVNTPDVKVSDRFPAVQQGIVNAEVEGITLFSVSSKQLDETGDIDSWLLAVDATGDIIWTYRNTVHGALVEQLPNGNLRLTDNAGSAFDVDMLGNPVAAWYGEKHYSAQRNSSIGVKSKILAVDGVHHHSVALTNGNRLVLAYESRRVEGALISPDGAKNDTQLIGDVIIELSPEGDVIQRWHLLDILDPERSSSGKVFPLNQDLYVKDDTGPPRDWSHAIGLAYDADTDMIWVSLAHQQAVLGVSYKTGRLEAILSHDKSWRLPWSEHLVNYTVSPKYSGENIFISAPYIIKGRLLLGVEESNGGHRVELVSVDGNRSKVEPYWSNYFGMKRLQTVSYSPDTNSVLVALYDEDKNEHMILEWLAPHSSSVKQDENEPLMSIKLVGNTVWHINDVVKLPDLVPPRVSNAAGFGSSSVDVASAAAIASSMPIRPSGPPISSIEEGSLIGEWQLLLETPEEQVLKTLTIDKQKAAVALGYLDDYPVIIAINGSVVSFTVRTTGVSGSAKWRYHGVVDINKVMTGRLTVTNSKRDVIVADVAWQAYK